MIYVANWGLLKERQTRAADERTRLTALLAELTRKGSMTNSANGAESRSSGSLTGGPRASSVGGGSATTSNADGGGGLPPERRMRMMDLAAGAPACSSGMDVSASDGGGKDVSRGGGTGHPAQDSSNGAAVGAQSGSGGAGGGDDGGQGQDLVAVDEVVEALGASAARELSLLVPYLLVNSAVCNNEQAGRCIAASWPYPINGTRLVAAARHALLFDADRRLPWARPPGSGAASGSLGG
jgi:hypothetical protein